MLRRKTRIKDITAKNVLNSSGDFCLEIEVELEDGTRAHESAPAGTTTGSYDAKLVSSEDAMGLVPHLRSELLGLPSQDQPFIDRVIAKCLPESSGRVKGANLSAATSMAVCRVAAACLGIPVYRHLATVFETQAAIPQLIVNVINGGAHAGNGLAIAEFMLVTHARDAGKAVAGVVDVYHELRRIIEARYGPASTHIGLEGGFAPMITDSRVATNLLSLAIERSSKGRTMSVGLDIAASNLYAPDRGSFRFGDEFLSTEDLLSYYVGLVEENDRVLYLEDPLAEDQVADWVRLRQRLPRHVIAGDDFVATDSRRLSDPNILAGINAVVLKINQCGTISALVECLRLARAHGLITVMSQRSRETDTDFLTHLAVGLGTDYLKAGACARERIIKYNSLLRIAASPGQLTRGSATV